MNVLVIAHAGVSVWWAFVGYNCPSRCFNKLYPCPKSLINMPKPIGLKICFFFNALYDGYA